MAVERGSVHVVMSPGWEARMGPQIDAVLDQVTEDVKDDIVRSAPVDRGDLVKSVHRRGHRVYVGTDHWHYVEYGTEPREFGPRTKKALWWPGAHHPVKKVYHPGTPAQPFMRPALFKRRTLRVPAGVG